MSKSVRMRIGDRRAIWNLVGECRELGDDRVAWRDHWVAGLADLVDAELGLAGEAAGSHDLSFRDLGVTFWWRPRFLDLTMLANHMSRFRDDPQYSPAMIEYFRHYQRQAGLCLSRKDFIEDRTWYRSADFELTHGPFGIDSTLWCFQPISGATRGEMSSVIIARAHGRKDFNLRDRTVIREAQTMIAPHVGSSLARYSDPSPSQLAPRVRQVLACVLQGDGDKQIAARLGLKPHTVNTYTKVLYHHFRVSSRAELLARWIRRGWGDRFGWLAPEQQAAVRFEADTVRGASFDPNHQF